MRTRTTRFAGGGTCHLTTRLCLCMCRTRSRQETSREERSRGTGLSIRRRRDARDLRATRDLRVLRDAPDSPTAIDHHSIITRALPSTPRSNDDDGGRAMRARMRAKRASSCTSPSRRLWCVSSSGAAARRFSACAPRAAPKSNCTTARPAPPRGSSSWEARSIKCRPRERSSCGASNASSFLRKTTKAFRTKSFLL